MKYKTKGSTVKTATLDTLEIFYIIFQQSRADGLVSLCHIFLKQCGKKAFLIEWHN